MCMDFMVLEALIVNAVFEALLKETQDLMTREMLTAKEATPSPMSPMGDVLEIQNRLGR